MNRYKKYALCLLLTIVGMTLLDFDPKQYSHWVGILCLNGVGFLSAVLQYPLIKL